MNSGAGDTTQLVPGSPIRTPWDHSSVDNSPRPIAASHVLHRLLVPRHPPSALSNLTTKMLASTVQFSTNNHPHPPHHNQHTNPDPTNRAHACTGIAVSVWMTFQNNPHPPPGGTTQGICSFRTQQGVHAAPSRTGRFPLPPPQVEGCTHTRPLPGTACQCLRR
jgi:hypothetical protein